jgi:predicted acylesterase/phospholipase RssA/CRP-like cAMP-binding protein
MGEELEDGLDRIGRRRILQDGDVLTREGDHADSAYFVLDGQLSVSVNGVEAHRSGPGTLAGEVAALTDDVRSATLTSIGTTEITEIDRADFLAWLQRHPVEAERIALSARNRLNGVQVTRIATEVLGPSAAPLVPELLQAMTWVDIPAGTVLFEQGGPSDAAYFVLTGRLQATRKGPGDDQPAVIGEIGRGEMVGESGIILDTPRTATVHTLRDCTLGRIDTRTFSELLVRHPQLMLLVVRRMVHRLTGTGTPVRTARSVGIVLALPGTHADNVRAFVLPMVAELERQGTTMVLSSDRIDRLLGRDGIAQLPDTDVASSRLQQLLVEVEADHQHLVFVADAEPTAWTRRALQRADTIIVISPPSPDRAGTERIGALVSTAGATRTPRWWVVVEPAGRERPSTAHAAAVRTVFDEVHHIMRGATADLERLARLSVGAGWGVVLGGGGARGYAHLGVLRAMRELGIVVDRIGGTSAGAVAAAIVGLVHDDDERIRIAETQCANLLDYTVPFVSLLKAKRISANLNAVFGEMDIEDLWLPYFCVSTNLTKSRLEVHRRGELATAIRASIAIPGVLPPVPYGEDLLVDGGVLDNVPADVMRLDPSIGTVIASDVAPKQGPGTAVDYGMYLSGWDAAKNAVLRRSSPYPGLGAVLVRTMVTSSEGRRAAMREDGTTDLYLDLDIPGVGMLEFDKLHSTVEAGYRNARPRLEAWLASRPS